MNVARISGGFFGGAAPIVTVANPATDFVATLVALTVAVPDGCGVSTPLVSIVPAPTGGTHQVTVLSGAFDGWTSAVNCCVCPTASCTVAGDTVIDFTA